MLTKTNTYDLIGKKGKRERGIEREREREREREEEEKKKEYSIFVR